MTSYDQYKLNGMVSIMDTDSGTTKVYVQAVVLQFCLVTKYHPRNYKCVTALESNGIPIVNQSGQVSFK